MNETETDKPEPPIFTGPSAQFDIDALLDRMRRDLRARAEGPAPRPGVHRQDAQARRVQAARRGGEAVT